MNKPTLLKAIAICSGLLSLIAIFVVWKVSQQTAAGFQSLASQAAAEIGKTRPAEQGPVNITVDFTPINFGIGALVVLLLILVAVLAMYMFNLNKKLKAATSSSGSSSS